MKTNNLSLNMSLHIAGAKTLLDEPNTGLLCQLYIENESATMDELKSLSLKHNISLELVTIVFYSRSHLTSKKGTCRRRFPLIFSS